MVPPKERPSRWHQAMDSGVPIAGNARLDTLPVVAAGRAAGRAAVRAQAHRPASGASLHSIDHYSGEDRHGNNACRQRPVSRNVRAPPGSQRPDCRRTGPARSGRSSCGSRDHTAAHKSRARNRRGETGAGRWVRTGATRYATSAPHRRKLYPRSALAGRRHCRSGRTPRRISSLPVVSGCRWTTCSAGLHWHRWS